jgi:hypothetical protein
MLEICTKMAKYAQNMQINLFVTMANKVHFKVFRCKISPVIGQNIFVHRKRAFYIAGLDWCVLELKWE